MENMSESGAPDRGQAGAPRRIPWPKTAPTMPSSARSPNRRQGVALARSPAAAVDAGDHARLAALVAERRAVACRLAELDAAITLEVAAMTRGRAQDGTPDRALLLPEAADRLGMSRDYIYRHVVELGGYRDADGRIKFSAAVVARHITRR